MKHCRQDAMYLLLKNWTTPKDSQQAHQRFWSSYLNPQILITS
jgi:hypothetical protein